MTKLFLFVMVITGNLYGEEDKKRSFVETRQFETMEICEAYGKFRAEEQKANIKERYSYYNCMKLQPAAKAE